MTVFSQKKQAYPSAAVKRNNNYCEGNLHNYGVKVVKCYETNSLLGLFRYPVEILCLFDKTLNIKIFLLNTYAFYCRRKPHKVTCHSGFRGDKRVKKECSTDVMTRHFMSRVTSTSNLIKNTSAKGITLYS